MSVTASWYLSGMYHPTHEEYLTDCRDRGRRMALDLIDGKVGVIEASRFLSGLRHELGSPFEKLLLPFAGIDSETDALLIGDVRKLWAPDVLARKDERIRSAEAHYRDLAVEAATKFLMTLEELEVNRQKKEPAEGGL